MKKRSFGIPLIIGAFFILSLLTAGCFYLPLNDYGDDVSKNDENNSESEKVESGIKLTSPVSFVRSGDSSVWFYGEVENKDDITHVFVQSHCYVKDNSGNVIASHSSYVHGDVVKLTNIDLNTVTALKPHNKGYIVFYVNNINYDDIDKVSCDIGYDDTNITEPDAKLTVVGKINVGPNKYNDVKYSGTLKNEGTKDLIFGEIDFFTRDKSGKIIGWDFTFVNGKRVYLPNIDDYTDTALLQGDTGTFEDWEHSVDFNQYGSFAYILDWEDTVIENGEEVESAPSASFVPMNFDDGIENRKKKLLKYYKRKNDTLKNLVESSY